MSYRMILIAQKSFQDKQIDKKIQSDDDILLFGSFQAPLRRFDCFMKPVKLFDKTKKK